VADLPPVLLPLRDRPQAAALFVDYDGTLAPIVDDPTGARPLDGVTELLARLARRFGLVAVVSGRPVAFLQAVLDRPAGVLLAGLYGMETATPGGAVEIRGGAEQWRPVVAEVTSLAEEEVPDGAEVEPKGLTVTLHWRRHPQAEGWARAFSERQTARTGLVVQAGRMALELRPPVADDKGSVVRAWAPGHAAAACFGDDLGDLPAFEALAELSGTGMAVARVAVVDAESPPEVAAAADLVVEGPEGAVALLTDLAGEG
jgi:trehalose 6-phosphate phosphatase